MHRHITGSGGNHVMTRTEKAIQRRRMSRKIRETVAIRRYTASLTAPPGTAAETSSSEQPGSPASPEV